MHQPHAVLGLVALLATGCIEIKIPDGEPWGSDTDTDPDPDTDWPVYEGEPAIVDTGGDECYWEWTRLGAFNSRPVYAVCVQGTFDGFVPDTSVVVPCHGAYSYTEPTYRGASEMDLGDGSFRSEAGPWLCNQGESGGTWFMTFDNHGECEENLLVDVNYVLSDSWGFPYLEDQNGIDCPAYMAYWANDGAGARTMASVRTGATSCTPGTGTFKLIARDVTWPSETGEVALRLTAIADSGTPYPERAWLREVEVVDWGGLDNISIAPFGEYLEFSGASIVNGYQIDAPSTSATLPPGSAPMGSMIGSEGVMLTSEFEPPTVELSWSCEAHSTSPHYSAVSDAIGYAGPLPAALGLDQRVVFWVDADDAVLRIAPEGRAEDFVRPIVIVNSATSWSFHGRLASYGADYQGTLTKVGANLVLTDANMTVGGTTYDLPTTTLTPL